MVIVNSNMLVFIVFTKKYGIAVFLQPTMPQGTGLCLQNLLFKQNT